MSFLEKNSWTCQSNKTYLGPNVMTIKYNNLFKTSSTMTGKWQNVQGSLLSWLLPFSSVGEIEDAALDIKEHKIIVIINSTISIF